MASWALLLVFCAFVSLCDSACFREHLNPGAKYCTDGYDKTQHPLRSTWRNDGCIRCMCSSTIMECCDMMGTAFSRTEGCIVKYDYSTCTFEVFHPEDPTIKCSHYAVGK